MMRDARASLSRLVPERLRPRPVRALAAGAGALPIAVALAPGGFALLTAARTGIVLATALVAAPTLVALAAALRGPADAARRLASPPDGEHRQGIARVPLGAAMLVYALGL